MPDLSPEEIRELLSRHLHRLLQSKLVIPVALGLGLVGLAGVLSMGGHDAGTRIRYVPVTRKIASGRITVNPADRVEYHIDIAPDMFNAQVIGSFTAYGGETNTVLAALMPTSEYANWITGHNAKAYYSSDGQKSEDKFAVRLDPGQYSFALSNRLSKKAMKFVYLDVELIYYRPERH